MRRFRADRGDLPSGRDNSASGLNRDRADLVGNPFLDTGRSRDALINQYFNIAAFDQNAPGTFGNSGRNIVRGPGESNVDLALVKNFPIRKVRAFSSGRRRSTSSIG